MLTKADLQQIRKVIREEVEVESKSIKDGLEHEIRTANLHLRKSLGELGDRTKNVELRLLSIEKELKSLRKDVKKLQKDVSVTIDVFNVEDTRLGKRVSRIEEHLRI
ncbi:MAG: hypothetical protein AAB520_04255 [Patescibacteria group bacterium]